MKIGDKCTRYLGGEGGIPMYVEVVHITDEHVYVSLGPTDAPPEEIVKQDGFYWKFDKETLAEVDEDIGWDGKTITGSILKRIDDGKNQ